MKKFGVPAVLLLSLCIILLGAFLPSLAASWQDFADSSQIHYAAVNNVQLEFNSNGQQSSLREKFALISKYSDSMSLPASLATLTENDIVRIVQDVVAKYQQSGLLPVGLHQISKRDILESQAYMVSWGEDESRSNIFWNVSVSLNTDLYLHLVLDDQTETVCAITYTDSSEDPQAQNQSEATLRARMAVLCTLYLEGLGQEFSQYDPESIARGGQYQAAGNSVSAHLSWGDLLYGEVKIRFYLSDDTFYVTIS